MTEFDLGGNFQTLREYRCQTGDEMDNSLLRDCLRSLDNNSGNDECVGIPREMKVALMGDHQAIITPVILPPSPTDVRKWMKNKESGSKVISTSNDQEMIENEIKSSEKLSCDIKVSNTPINGNLEISGESTYSPSLVDSSIGIQYNSQSAQVVSKKISCNILHGPQHSTPVVNPGMKSRKFEQWTPIAADEAKMSKEDLDVKIFSDEKSSKIKNLRRNIINSQIKVSLTLS